MKVAIIDDEEVDHRMLESMLKREFPESECHHYYGDRNPCEELEAIQPDIIFQDISISGDNIAPNSEGLKLLKDYSVLLPEIPVVIISGHVIQKISEIISEHLGRDPQLVHILDKASYTGEDLRQAVSKGREFREREKRRNLELAEYRELLLEQSKIEQALQQQLYHYSAQQGKWQYERYLQIAEQISIPNTFELVHQLFPELKFHKAALAELAQMGFPAKVIRVLRAIDANTSLANGQRPQRFRQSNGEVMEYRYSQRGRILVDFSSRPPLVTMITDNPPWH